MGATKEDIAEVARILAMQAAHFARKYGEEQLPDVAHLLSATTLEDDSVGLRRDGTEALVGVLAMVTGVGRLPWMSRASKANVSGEGARFFQEKNPPQGMSISLISEVCRAE